MLNGSAKAVTPFGVLAGRTPVSIHYGGDDLAVTSFMCGPTPVELALSGEHLETYIRRLIDTLAEIRKAAYIDTLNALAVDDVA